MQKGKTTPEGTEIFAVPHIVVGVPLDEREKLNTSTEDSMITRLFGSNIPPLTSLAIAHSHFAHTVAPEDVVFTEEFKKLGKPNEKGEIVPKPTNDQTMTAEEYWQFFLTTPFKDPENRHPRLQPRKGEVELLSIVETGKNKDGLSYIPMWELDNLLALPIGHCTIAFAGCISRIDETTFEISGIFIRESTYENPVTKIELNDSTLYRYDFKHIPVTNPYPWVTDSEGNCVQGLSFYFSTTSEYTVAL